MKTTLTLLRAGAVSALMLSATLAHAADPQPLILKDVSGAVRIQQSLPCGNALDLRTSIVRGYMQMTVFQVSPRRGARRSDTVEHVPGAVPGGGQLQRRARVRRFP